MIRPASALMPMNGRVAVASDQIGDQVPPLAPAAVCYTHLTLPT